MLTFGVRTSNTFESVSSISTGLELRINYWILESFPPRMPGCSTVLFLDLGMAAEQLHTLASRRSSPVQSGLERCHGARGYREADRDRIFAEHSPTLMLSGLPSERRANRSEVGAARCIAQPLAAVWIRY